MVGLIFCIWLACVIIGFVRGSGQTSNPTPPTKSSDEYNREITEMFTRHRDPTLGELYDPRSTNIFRNPLDMF